MNKKQIILMSFLLIGLVFLSVPAVANAFSLVPCGTSTNPDPCEFRHLIIMAITLINYLISLAALVAIAMILLAGFRLITALGNPEQISTGKAGIQNALVGFLLILFAFLIVNFFVSSIFGGDSSRQWWSLECLYAPGTAGCPFASGITAVAPSPVAPAQPLPPEVTVAALEIQSLVDYRITLSTSADCSGYHAQGNINDMANGQYPYVCSPTCSCARGGSSGTIYAQPGMLQGLVTLAREHNYPFTITSITTGRHSTNSSHYQGRGVDIVPQTTNRTVWQDVRALLNSISGTAICEHPTTGQNVPSCEDVSHIHWTYN